MDFPFFVKNQPKKVEIVPKFPNLTLKILIFNFSLLAQNQVSDFHSEIERLTYDEMQNDLYIKHPIKIEQYLMEGNYNKVLIKKHIFFNRKF